MPTFADTGSLAALVPTVVPAPARSAVSGLAHEPGDHLQPADFAAFLLAAGAPGLELPAAPLVPGAAPPPSSNNLPAFGFPDSWAPATPLRMLMPGGRFSPPSGSALPPVLPPTRGSVAQTGRFDTSLLSTSIELQSASLSGATPGAASDPLPSLFGATNAGATSTPWLRALLANERGTRATEPLLTQSGDAVSTGDSLLALANGTRDAAPMMSIALPTSPAQQPAFEQALGERLAWLVQEGRHDARIKLHPVELGSIDIRLSLDGDSTRISLASPHAAVRDALELAVPRLRELLGSAGLDLSQVNVGTGDARSHGDFGQPTPSSAAAREHFAHADDAEALATTLAIRLPQGLVDTFA